MQVIAICALFILESTQFKKVDNNPARTKEKNKPPRIVPQIPLDDSEINFIIRPINRMAAIPIDTNKTVLLEFENLVRDKWPHLGHLHCILS